MKIFPHPPLRRLTRDLAALCRLVDMMVVENERQTGRAAAREKRRQQAQEAFFRRLAARGRQATIPPEPDGEWPE